MGNNHMGNNHMGNNLIEAAIAPRQQAQVRSTDDPGV
jgi:hypothetical protein